MHNPSPSNRVGGLPLALGAHLIWGLLPLYLWLVAKVPAFEFVGWRVMNAGVTTVREASSLVTTAAAVKTLTEALAPHGVGLDVPALCDRFAVPVTSLAPTADVLASVATNAEKPAQEAA